MIGLVMMFGFVGFAIVFVKRTIEDVIGHQLDMEEEEVLDYSFLKEGK
ncbi:MAG TPA: hypothetical protein PK567_01205 [Bacillota bacterium]|nr:hypothetical protein [Bacillota bacterium]